MLKAVANLKQYTGAMANLSNWYESKSWKTQKLIDVICEKTRLVISEHHYDAFIDSINCLGIDCDRSFVAAFFAEYEGQADDVVLLFINDWMKLAKGCLPKRLIKDMDPEQLWNEVVKFDFYRIPINGHTYFFKRNYS